MGPSGVPDQSIDRISLPISPPPTSQSCALLLRRRALVPPPDGSTDIRSFSTPGFHIAERGSYLSQATGLSITQSQPTPPPRSRPSFLREFPTPRRSSSSTSAAAEL